MKPTRRGFLAGLLAAPVVAEAIQAEPAKGGLVPFTGPAPIDFRVPQIVPNFAPPDKWHTKTGLHPSVRLKIGRKNLPVSSVGITTERDEYGGRPGLASARLKVLLVVKKSRRSEWCDWLEKRWTEGRRMPFVLTETQARTQYSGHVLLADFELPSPHQEVWPLTFLITQNVTRLSGRRISRA